MPSFKYYLALLSQSHRHKKTIKINLDGFSTSKVINYVLSDIITWVSAVIAI